LREGRYIDAIHKAEDVVREYEVSAENTRRKAFYATGAPSSGYWYGISANDKIKPVVVELERETYARVLGYSMIDFYTDPLSQYLSTLRTMIYKFERFQDCTPISKTFSCFMGGGFEKSIFGFAPIHSEHDSWVSREYLFPDDERPSIGDLEVPDFFCGGCMPQTHAFYERMREIASDDFTVAFPQWIRSPWAVAWELRGIERLLIDYIEEPEWTAALIAYVTHCQISWCRQWERYTGTAMHTCMIGNDEVTSPMVSPVMYRELIMPSEIRLSETFGGINYWHSCGNTTPFMRDINRLPNLDMVHVSPWSDLEAAGEIYDRDKRLEICLFAYEDLLFPPSEHHLADKLKTIRRQSAGHRGTVSANGIQLVGGVEEGLAQVDRFLELANEIILEES